MKKIAVTIISAGILLWSCNNEGKTEAPAADVKADTAAKAASAETAPPTMDSAAMMKAWMDFATPGPMHAWMAKTNGTWEAEVDQWMAPGAPPVKAKAVNVQTSAIGGRYVLGKYTSTMMGGPFEGMSTMAYDNVKKTFISTWIDNMGTGIVQMSGGYDEASKTLSLKGKQSDPISGKESDIRQDMKIIDDNSYSIAMYGTGPDGKEMKFMEGIFKRKK
jgi:hypothetical protein